ncbi:F-box only protein 24-like [Acipenser oxyrinchus oxyrinchus]|uniref:F-box only protein 24-like n=1 Tax=Acipenser oxyrinchus oxyrinchus TaxID=40147 RepID=A0AAD8FVQ4_ACIOX|nr:F-box only protein 24-like [Acipenser oxyrinchus oxyrinchus]
MANRTGKGKYPGIPRYCRGEEPPKLKRKREQSEPKLESTGKKWGGKKEPVSIQSLPPELLDGIIAFLGLDDVVSLGQVSRCFRELCHSEGIWRRLCSKVAPRYSPDPHSPEEAHWRREALLNYTKGLFFQTFGGRKRLLSRAVAPHLSHGYRKFLPTKDHVFILDHNGTLFFLKNALVSSPLGQIQWKRACRYVVLCRHAKDFATDPRSDTAYRKYLYVLARRELAGAAVRGPDSTALRCDCVEVYLQSSGQRVFKMTFHSSMRFRDIRLVGQESERALLLLTDEGKVYSLTVNETQLDQPRSYTVQLSMRKITKCLPHLCIKQVHSNQSSVLYVTDAGGVYFEVHTAGVYRDLFGTLHAFDPIDLQMPLALPLPSKVMSCSLGFNHLGLVDEFGRIFMQGNNRYGQLGTGDKIDRGEPTQVPYLCQPVSVWCGLNHSLVLLETLNFGREVQGCGCGAGGRLPGWPKGSATFVRLQIQAPRCVCSLCSTRDCLYMMSCHDIDLLPAFRTPPLQRSRGGQAEGEEAGLCRTFLTELRSCTTLPQQLDRLKDIVNHMTLPSFQRDFLCEALNTIQSTRDGLSG